MKKLVMAIILTALVATSIPLGVVGAQTASDDASLTAQRALAIRNPSTVVTERPVPIQVLETNTGRPVARAGVWAIDISSITTDSVDAKAYAELAEKHGQFLGRTNQRGYVSPFPKFGETGKYILVAVKNGYTPGFSRIQVVSQRALAINAPDRVLVDRPVPIQVTDRNSGHPVAGAGVWAIDVRNLTTASIDVEAYAELAEKHGQFLGRTNQRGYVSPFPKFGETGKYILVAVKNGYTPGFSRIQVVSQRALAINAPDRVLVDRPVPIQVTDRNSGHPVAGAGVWAIDVRNLTTASIDVEAYAELAEKHGQFLGRTNQRGYVSPFPSFSDPGHYILVAIKDGFKPGFDKVVVLKLQVATAEPIPISDSLRVAFEDRK